jgi:hypothetical protein
LGDDDANAALNNASTAEIVDLAGILGLHSMMNQDQYHSAQSDKVCISNLTIVHN